MLPELPRLGLEFAGRSKQLSPVFTTAQVIAAPALNYCATAMAQLDNFETQQKRQSLVAAVVIGLLLSNISLALRLWARLRILKRLRKEDWFMIVGLFLSYGTVVCLLYGKFSLPIPFVGSRLTTRHKQGCPWVSPNRSTVYHRRNVEGFCW